MKSTHQAIVIDLKLEPHPNADSLSICKVNEVFTVVLNTKDWAGKTKAVYIPPQNVVDTTRPEFSFLKVEGSNEALVKPIKLRGIHSYGLCAPCSEDLIVGTDVTAEYILRHDEPEERFMGGKFTNGGPLGSSPKYDVDSIFKKAKYWKSNDLVVVTEKIHGQNMRVYWDGTTLHVGGRNKWFEEDNSLYWKVIRDYPQITELCKTYPNHILYGEQYGHTNLKYGHSKNKPGFAAFDIRRPDLTFIDYNDFLDMCNQYHIPTTNLIYVGEFESYEGLSVWSNGQSTYDQSHIREGVVVKTVSERLDPLNERMVFKIINPNYKG